MYNTNYSLPGVSVVPTTKIGIIHSSKRNWINVDVEFPDYSRKSLGRKAPLIMKRAITVGTFRYHIVLSAIAESDSLWI